MHVLTPTVFHILEELFTTAKTQKEVTLAAALTKLAQREQYLALEMVDLRYDIGVKYGLMTAQIALALSGKEKDHVLSLLVELLAERQLGKEGK
jgi:UTP--glucose-1-phosphate uridylyltransferase